MDYTVDEKVRYTKTHEWVRREGGEAVVGISDYAQNHLSDVVFVELPAMGKEMQAGKACMVIESVKAAEEVFAPVSGVVSGRNEKLEKAPELVNKDPFGEGWLVKVKLGNPARAGQPHGRGGIPRVPGDPMSFIPNTDADRSRMLEAVGIGSVAELFHDVPAEAPVSAARSARAAFRAGGPSGAGGIGRAERRPRAGHPASSAPAPTIISSPASSMR